jgi:hypothetical protein
MQQLKLQPYKATVVHALQPCGPASRIIFCNWFLQSVHNDEGYPHLTFLSDEAWFHLHRSVSSQNNWYWNPINSHLIHKVALHGIKVGVCCALNGK